MEEERTKTLSQERIGTKGNDKGEERRKEEKETEKTEEKKEDREGVLRLESGTEKNERLERDPLE